MVNYECFEMKKPFMKIYTYKMPIRIVPLISSSSHVHRYKILIKLNLK